MAHGGHETEIKLAVEDAAAGRRLLGRHGFRVFKRRVFEANTVYDTSDLRLRRAQSLLRLRQAGRSFKLTYKGPPTPGRHKSREELELDLPALSPFDAILERLGYQPVFRYEKYRTEFRRPGVSGVATLDETPIGTYLELEGQPAWIDRTARLLGKQDSDYITASYGTLYREWCASRGCEPGDMVFPAGRAGR